MEDLTGKQFGHYQIVAPLGEGGMAAVYKAYQPNMERYVAIKVLPRHMSASEEFVNRFKREAKMLAQLQHPHILPVFDYGEADGYPYIVMPFVNSGTLAELLQRRPLSLPETRRIITQLGEALSYAHARGMIHRDIKPSNVLIDERGNCLLTDFGLARMAAIASTKITTSGTVMGTPAYMSPEQGMGSNVDQRSDIYSLGVILYEMVTGRVPYMAETPVAIVFKHIQDPLPSARKLNPNLPEVVELVLLKALAKNPEDRYQTGDDFAQAIQRSIPDTSFDGNNPSVRSETIEHGISISEKNMGRFEPSQIESNQSIKIANNTPQSRKFKSYGLAFAIIATLAIAFAWAAFRRDNNATESFATFTPSSEQPLEPSNTEESSFIPQGEPVSSSYDQFNYAPVSTPLVLEGTKLPSLSQGINIQNMDQLAQVARWGKGRINQSIYSNDGTLAALATTIGIHILDAKNLKQILFIDTTREINAIAFSADGESITAVSNHGDILKFNTTDGAFIKGIEGNFNNINSVSIAPDLSSVALTGYSNGNYSRKLSLISAEDGSLLNEFNNDVSDSTLQNLTYSPDNLLVAGVGGSDGKIYVWDAADGTLLRTIADQQTRISYITFSPDSKTIASTSNDGAIILWEARSGESLLTLEGHGTYISALAFSPDGTNIIYRVGSDEAGLIRIRNISDGSLVNSFPDSVASGWGSSIAVSPGGESILLTVENRSLSLWNLNQGSVVESLTGFSSFTNKAAISADGKFLVSGSEFGELWQIEEGNIVQTISATPVYNGAPMFSTAGQLIYNTNEGIGIWNLKNGSLTKVRDLSYIYYNDGMALSPNGSILAIPNGAKIDLWDTTDSSKINSLSGYAETDTISSLAFSSDGLRLVSGSYDNIVIIWDMINGSAKHILKQHLGQIYSVAFSTNGKTVASSSYDGTIILWSVDEGKAIKTIELPPRVYANSLAYSPDGEILAAGSDDGAIYIWQVNNGNLLKKLEGHTNTTTSLAFTPDGKLLISSSYDGTIRLWGITP